MGSLEVDHFLALGPHLAARSALLSSFLREAQERQTQDQRYPVPTLRRKTFAVDFLTLVVSDSAVPTSVKKSTANV